MFNFLPTTGAAQNVPAGTAGDLNISDPYLAQIPEILKKYYAPYAEMYQQPGAIMGRLGAGFQTSPGYQFELGQELQAGKQAAAAGGMAGTPMAQTQAQETAQGLASKDYYSYLNNAMRMYMGGVQGYSGLGENLANVMLSQSQLAQMQREEEEREEEEEEAQRSQLFGAGLGALGGIVGGALGGPGGAMAGSSIGRWFNPDTRQTWSY